MTTLAKRTLHAAAIMALGGSFAACGNANLAVRGGPQAVHPSPSKLAQGTSIASTAATPTGSIAKATSSTRALFDLYCAPYGNNAERVRAIEASGNFTGGGFGKLPVQGYEDLVFVFYKQKGAPEQVGVASRAGGQNFCVAVDGTATGTEYYVAGP